jgi:carbon-monoxide dehydrogenase large subunit
MAGSAILDAAVKFKTLIRQTAAADLRCSPEEVAIETDRLTGPKSSVPLSKYAGLTCEGVFLNTRHTWAYGAHAAHVRVDPRTGHIEILDYVVVEDVGRIVNPLTMSGQVIGSLVQGLGGTLLEELKYDENAQLLTGSLADYLLPTATDFPNLRSVLLEEAPSPINPLGAKGAGEGGTIGAGGCIANAVANALQTFGVQPRSLPLSPNAVWEMIQAAPASQIKKPGELSVASVL